MKSRTIFLLLLTLLMATLMLVNACGDDDDDDNDDSGGSSSCEDFCNRVFSCGLQDQVAGNTAEECTASCELGTPAQGYCVLAATDCAGVAACFESAGDDDDDDDDDNDNNDDSSPTGDHDPELDDLNIYLGSYDLNIVSEVSIGHRQFSDEEYVLLAPEFFDKDCDLAGGEMFYSLDGAEGAVYDTLPSYIECRDTQLSDLFGYDLDQIPGAREDGDHMLDLWWTDAAGNKSNKVSTTYEIGEFPTSIGAEMADFTLPSQDDTDVSLSDFMDNYVILVTFAEWCTYCSQECNELDDAMADWNDEGLPVTVLGMMKEDSSGNYDLDQEDLLEWYTDHGWDGYAGDMFVLNDGGGEISNDYYIGVGVPFTMILDRDFIIRAKWHGYSSGLIERVIDDLFGGTK